MDINDNNAEDRNEEALLELEQIKAREAAERIKDRPTDYSSEFKNLL